MSLVFFTDRDLGNQFPDVLAAAGVAVERHARHFEPDCPDERWLRHIGTKAWVAITHDRRIRYKPNEREAVIRHRVRLLVVVGKAPFRDLAASFVHTLPRIHRYLDEHSAPCIAKVYRPTPKELAENPAAAGRVEHWYPPTSS